jgi:hypothetical protein
MDLSSLKDGQEKCSYYMIITFLMKNLHIVIPNQIFSLRTFFFNDMPRIKICLSYLRYCEEFENDIPLNTF